MPHRPVQGLQPLQGVRLLLPRQRPEPVEQEPVRGAPGVRVLRLQPGAEVLPHQWVGVELRALPLPEGPIQVRLDQAPLAQPGQGLGECLGGSTVQPLGQARDGRVRRLQGHEGAPGGGAVEQAQDAHQLPVQGLALGGQPRVEEGHDGGGMVGPGVRPPAQGREGGGPVREKRVAQLGGQHQGQGTGAHGPGSGRGVPSRMSVPGSLRTGLPRDKRRGAKEVPNRAVRLVARGWRP
jgi:hypothetical protein